MTTQPYQLKEPKGYDLYEGEWFDGWTPESAYRAIFRASAKFYDNIIREDKRVASYVNICNSYSQKYGLYHFLLPGDISEQANLLLNVASRVGFGHMPLIVDVEIYPNSYGITNRTWQDQVKQFMDIVEAKTNDSMMIYTSKNYWDYVCVNGVAPSWTNLHPLWTAYYPRPATIIDTVNNPYILPKGWTHWELWQYDDSGRSYGYPNNDYDVFSEAYKKTLDEKYETITPSLFPSNIYIADKTYKEAI